MLWMARVSTPPKPTRSIRASGEDVEICRSPQAVACRKRYVEELGRPHGLLAAGRGDAGYTVIEARKGKPRYRQYRNLHATLEGGSGKAEKYCERESLPDADGESYQA